MSGAALACLFPGVASAAQYDVASLAELNNALATITSTGDPTPVIVLRADITTSINVLTSTSPLTVDTNGHTLTGPQFSGGQAVIVTGTGNVVGLSNVAGLVVNNGANVTNEVSVEGASFSTPGTTGQIGASVMNNSTLANSGSIVGGNGTTAGGPGVQVSSGGQLTNNVSGTIQGGSGSQGLGGIGVAIGSPAGAQTKLTNNGTILGGEGTTGGGIGVVVRTNNVGTITNTGKIQGGTGAAAIMTNSVGGSLSIVNSGSISGGAGANAISLIAGSTGSLKLELQAGSAIIGNVVGGNGANDVLTVGGDTAAVLDGMIGAAGQYRNFDILQKTGASTWALTADNTATQAWTISQGTLQIGNGGTTGSILGNVTNNGTLAFDRSDTYTYAGVISGSGAVSQIGAGTTVLTGDNTYTGGTTISAGTLQLGNGGTSGSISGDVTDNGTLAFNRSDAVTFAGVISGSGAVNQIGTGTTTLTADNTYTGVTTISAGTLQLGNGGTSGSIAGNVTNNGTLIVDRSNGVTLAGAISGSGSVVQQGAGSTTLAGTNSYGGGTTISAGTLIGQATSFGTGNILNDAALVFDQPANAAFASIIEGSGTLTKRGAGNLGLTGINTLNGATTIEAGKLSVNGSLANSAVTILGGGALGGNGTVGSTTLQAGGVIAPGNSIGLLTIQGNFVGAGGAVEIEAILDGDASSTDKLVIAGNTSGTANVKVIGLGGGGAQTVDGIKIIDVGGTSAGTFNLLGDYVFQGDQAVVAGAYAYRMYQNGISTPADGDWYLRSALINPVDPGGPSSPLYAPSVPVYEAYAGVLQSFNQLGTLQQRAGNRSWTGAALPDADDRVEGGSPIWGRIEAAHKKLDPGTSTTGTDYDADLWRLQAGLDGQLAQMASGVLTGGVTVHYGTVKSDISSAFGLGSIDTTGYGFGGTLTWYGNSGFYVDAQAELTWFDSDLSSATLGNRLVKGNNGFGYGLGIEAGQKIGLQGNWSLTPQAQLSYSSVDFDSFTDPYGAVVANGGSDSLIGRLGLSADYESRWKDKTGRTSRSHVYGIGNLYYDFVDGSDVDVSGTVFSSKSRQLSGGLGVGGSLSWADDRYSVNGEVLARTSLEDFGDSRSIGGTVGFKVKW
ncbi:MULTISPECIES: autotransporter outer membrane beta-barrel domain-containing protein [unclassified Mesorhizobium]|uniref:autotransporter outer membrane beta-barrel domain-containing protein n=1 Tax=unclassified Mesorhizobium TaxID=325217 RepID=UPI001AECE028|nr:MULTISPECIES: autotransporter outer membrane beta-barrel domain-containing protein [unclassified Mesorhizobium]